jgi:hypothetical protein
MFGIVPAANMLVAAELQIAEVKAFVNCCLQSCQVGFATFVSISQLPA